MTATHTTGDTNRATTLPDGWGGGAPVWVVDTEFSAPPGHRPRPWCVVLQNARTGEVRRIWVDDLNHPPPCPYDPARDVLVTYYGSAEGTVFRVLGWPHPARHIDLHAELRVLHGAQNMPRTGGGWGLVDACHCYGVPFLDAAQKDTFRDIAIRGPRDDAERRTLVDYCAVDVAATRELFLKTAGTVGTRLPHAYFRGAYVNGVADMQHTGTPVDADTLSRIIRHWPAVVRARTEDVMRRWPVFKLNGKGDHSTDLSQWAATMRARGISWPTTPTGRPCTDDDTLKDMASAHPELNELRHALTMRGAFKLGPTLHVGPDNRNRCMLGQFRSATGRNQPSNAAFVFGPSTWVRSLIQAPAGRCLVYADLSGAEIGIGGALSDDPNLCADYASGDPYTHFGRHAGIIPPGGDKKTHPKERDLAKRIMLAAGYGAGAKRLSALLNISVGRTRELMDAHRRRYPRYWAFSAGVVEKVQSGHELHTPLGWRATPARNSDFNPRSAANWPHQATCADILRTAVVLARRRGIEICAPVHDALLVEGPDDAADELAARMRDVWRDASRVVLGKCALLSELRSDATIVRAGGRYSDARGMETWAHIVASVTRLESESAAETAAEPRGTRASCVRH